MPLTPKTSFGKPLLCPSLSLGLKTATGQSLFSLLYFPTENPWGLDSELSKPSSHWTLLCASLSVIAPAYHMATFTMEGTNLGESFHCSFSLTL